MRTPWGTSQDQTEYADGVTFYSTASHGGFKLSARRNAEVPDYMRSAGGWYEEDCEWCIVAIIHPDAFPKATDHEAALSTFRGWMPDQYERFFGVVLQPGESSSKDRRTFYAAHAADLLVIAAWGDWAEGVPKGMVGVVATIGGSREPGREATERWFLVPGAEYAARRSPAFLIDPARHQAITRLSGASRKVAAQG